MKRDPDLIRKLLLRIEECPFPNQYVTFKFAGHEAEEIVYHVTLLCESGLIEAEENKYSCFDEWNNVRLTWRGHELLELVRDQTRWQNALERAEQVSGGTVNFELVGQVLLRRGVNTAFS